MSERRSVEIGVHDLDGVFFTSTCTCGVCGVSGTDLATFHIQEDAAMSTQIPKRRNSEKSDQEEQKQSGTASLTERGEDIKRAMDELLDDIDDVLEENAEEFVAGYVQRGGE